jgi:hypothetical protein
VQLVPSEGQTIDRLLCYFWSRKILYFTNTENQRVRRYVAGYSKYKAALGALSGWHRGFCREKISLLKTQFDLGHTAGLKHLFGCLWGWGELTASSARLRTLRRFRPLSRYLSSFLILLDHSISWWVQHKLLAKYLTARSIYLYVYGGFLLGILG